MQNFLLMKTHLKCLRNGGHFVRGNMNYPSIYSSWRDEQIKQNMNTEYGFYEANCIYLQIVLQSSENFSHLLAYRRSLIY